jgi:hypothetical protein
VLECGFRKCLSPFLAGFEISPGSIPISLSQQVIKGLDATRPMFLLSRPGMMFECVGNSDVLLQTLLRQRF